MGSRSLVRSVCCRSTKFKTALVADLHESMSGVSGAKDTLVKNMANKLDIKTGAEATRYV